MIAIFSDEKTAAAFAEKCHNWLALNCPGYNAERWQNPTPNKDKTAYYIQIPDEYYKQFYKDSEKIIAATKPEYDKKTAETEKPDPAVWSADVSK